MAVLPEADTIDDVVLNAAELRIDTFRASGAGGQHVNKTESAIRVTHLPTGIVVECQDSRSQHKNREKALSVLAARIRDKQEREQQQKMASTRKSLIGSGDRSERIRTYNFPQGRSPTTASTSRSTRSTASWTASSTSSSTRSPTSTKPSSWPALPKKQLDRPEA